jgi:hypothetical protein
MRRETMKNKLIVGAVLVACTVVLTLMTGLAQARVAADEIAVEEFSENVITPQAINPRRFFSSVCRVGPRGGDTLLTCFGLGFTSPNPRIVLCQTRNSPNEPVNFPDQFACQVIRTDPGSVQVRIRRLDAPGAGWGQDLHLNLLVVQ